MCHGSAAAFPVGETTVPLVKVDASDRDEADAAIDKGAESVED